MSIDKTSAHFVGIGGIGMSALAELFQSLGATVSGSDLSESKQTEHLEKKGISVAIGHDTDHITETMDVVVYSSAIKSDNPEIQQARKYAIPIIPRAEALAEVMRFKRGIAVGGTHGKTTTTSMISSIFLHADFDPTIAVGGRLKLIESTARLGKGPWMVAEADESDGSFARLQPEISIVTNIDSDHLDFYGSFENLQQAFLNFALNVPYFGCSVVFGDDPKTRELLDGFTKRVFFYGEDDSNDYVLKKKGRLYEVFHKEESMGELDLAVPGVHNALNALAACIACHQAGVPWEKCLSGVNSYSGVDRRFQWIGEVGDIKVFDDYAHHPTEIAATVAAVQDIIGKGRFHLIYQPHRFTRTRDCWNDYQSCFSKVDNLYLVDIYPAGEAAIEGVHSSILADQIGAKATYYSDHGAVIDKVQKSVRAGDIVMTMGAGQVWRLSTKIVEKLES